MYRVRRSMTSFCKWRMCRIIVSNFLPPLTKKEKVWLSRSSYHGVTILNLVILPQKFEHRPRTIQYERGAQKMQDFHNIACIAWSKHGAIVHGKFASSLESEQNFSSQRLHLFCNARIWLQKIMQIVRKIRPIVDPKIRKLFAWVSSSLVRDLTIPQQKFREDVLKMSRRRYKASQKLRWSGKDLAVLSCGIELLIPPNREGHPRIFAESRFLWRTGLSKKDASINQSRNEIWTNWSVAFILCTPI